jgi:hypothetical protein
MLAGECGCSPGTASLTSRALYVDSGPLLDLIPKGVFEDVHESYHVAIATRFQVLLAVQT